MAREGIYVGNKEVTHRYIGTRLIWVKIRLLFSGDVSINYDSQLKVWRCTWRALDDSSHISSVETVRDYAIINLINRLYI